MSKGMFHHHSHQHEGLEKVGFYLSLLCAVHCIAMPVLLTVLPMMGGSFLNNPTYELALIGVSMLLAVWILWTDYQKHLNRLPLLLLGISLLLKMLEIAFLPTRFEVITASFSAILIAVAYFINWRSRARC